MKLQCPHCEKDITIRVDAEDEVKKMVAKETEGLRIEIVKLRKENRELKVRN